MVSTITSDVSTIQASRPRAAEHPRRWPDHHRHACVMLYLNFDFALIVVVVTPVLLYFISHFKKR
jgi:hypothetical protein